MTKEEAEEIITRDPADPLDSQGVFPNEYMWAKGFLEGYSQAEAKAEVLVKAVQVLLNIVPAGANDCDTICCAWPSPKGSITNGPNVTRQFQEALKQTKSALSEYKGKP